MSYLLIGLDTGRHHDRDDHVEAVHATARRAASSRSGPSRVPPLRRGGGVVPRPGPEGQTGAGAGVVTGGRAAGPSWPIPSTGGLRLPGVRPRSPKSGLRTPIPAAHCAACALASVAPGCAGYRHGRPRQTPHRTRLRAGPRPAPRALVRQRRPHRGAQRAAAQVRPPRRRLRRPRGGRGVAGQHGPQAAAQGDGGHGHRVCLGRQAGPGEGPPPRPREDGARPPRRLPRPRPRRAAPRTSVRASPPTAPRASRPRPRRPTRTARRGTTAAP